MNTTVTVTAGAAARAGCEQQLLDLARALVPLTRAEDGCLHYRLFRQQDAAGCRLQFIEEWASREHLDAHTRTAHLQAFLADSAPLLAEPLQIAMWQDVSA